MQQLKDTKGGMDDTLFVLTADHGQVLNDEDQSLNLNSHPELLSKLRLPPAGERRSFVSLSEKGGEQAVREWAQEKGQLFSPVRKHS